MTSPVKPVDRMTAIAIESSTTVLNSHQIWLAGCQSIMHAIAADAQARVEQNWSNWTSLAKTKSMQEALKMQTGFAHSAIQGSLDGSARLTNASVQLIQKTMAPIADHMTRSLETPTAPAE